DYIKISLLRSLSVGVTLGVAWYRFPDEAHNADGRHISYLTDPKGWRYLDPKLFDEFNSFVARERSISALERCFAVTTKFVRAEVPGRMTPAKNRDGARSVWFGSVLKDLDACKIIFADPDNGLVDDREHRRSQIAFGKQMPLSEAVTLSSGRPTIVYHHNSRFKGGHDAEVDHWLGLLGRGTIAIRATAYSCRTFFILNPNTQIKERAAAFCETWRDHKVRMHGA
ncbi:MAG: hypothetical protein ACK4G5_11730, partial [Devosia sp.]